MGLESSMQNHESHSCVYDGHTVGKQHKQLPLTAGRVTPSASSFSQPLMVSSRCSSAMLTKSGAAFSKVSSVGCGRCEGAESACTCQHRSCCEFSMVSGCRHAVPCR